MFRRATPSALTLALAALLAAATPARATAAAAPAASAARSFDAAFFADQAPANAWDMVQRLPGFVIVEADADVRGYAGAMGNVLIDGARPASKQDELSALLQRIPAAAVERIELIRAGDGGYDMGGHALLANVVRRADPAPEIAAMAGIASAADGWRTGVGEFEYGRHRDDTALEVAFARRAEADEDGGAGHLRVFDAAGALAEAADTDVRSVVVEHAAGANWRQPFAGGRLHLDVALRQELVDVAGLQTPTLAGTDAESVVEDGDAREAELAVRWSRLVGGRRIAALASQRRGWLSAREVETEDDGIESFVEDTRVGESLAGLEFGWDGSDTLALTGGVELAYNVLESRAQLHEDGVEVALPGADVRVAERRGEAAFAASWHPAGDWRFEAGLRVEASRLAQSGDSALARRFVYVKPRFAATWEPDGRHTLRWSLARDVGQLDFGDFVAGASLADGDVAAGNPRLEPDKTWRSTLAWEFEFGDDGSLQLRWMHDRIDDVLDRVPVVAADGEVFDAPGNLGAGRRDGLALELGTGLAALGWPTMRLDVSMLWQRSRVRDPVTGRMRGISEEKPREGEITLEQVLPDRGFSWGIGYELAESETGYRFDQVTYDDEGGRWEAFAEKAFAGGWRLRAELADPDGVVVRRRRERHDGPRGDGTLDEVELRRHRAPATLLLTLRRDIGG